VFDYSPEPPLLSEALEPLQIVEYEACSNIFPVLTGKEESPACGGVGDRAEGGSPRHRFAFSYRRMSGTTPLQSSRAKWATTTSNENREEERKKGVQVVVEQELKERLKDWRPPAGDSSWPLGSFLLDLLPPSGKRAGPSGRRTHACMRAASREHRQGCCRSDDHHGSGTRPSAKGASAVVIRQAMSAPTTLSRRSCTLTRARRSPAILAAAPPWRRFPRRAARRHPFSERPGNA